MSFNAQETHKQTLCTHVMYSKPFWETPRAK